MSILTESIDSEFSLIALTKGEYAIVDSDKFEFLSQWKWYYKANKDKITGYAARIDLSSGKRIYVSMHRLVCLSHYNLASEGVQDIDHINGNRLDNRASNLRPATRHQNSGNRGANKISKSGYKGVDLSDPVKMVWRAQITDNGKKKSIGYFATKEEAALAYNQESLRIFGEFAYQNVVVGVTEFTKLIYRSSKEFRAKGVSFHRGTKKWVAYTRESGRRIHIEYFKTEQEAISARINFIENKAERA
jgi:HNH endonuclease/AP2 domain